MSIPALLCIFAIDGRQVNYAEARGAVHDHQVQVQGFSALRKDHVLLYFLFAAFLFHLANAAMLPELGEMLSKNNLKPAARRSFHSTIFRHPRNSPHQRQHRTSRSTTRRKTSGLLIPNGVRQVTNFSYRRVPHPRPS
jgi:hypothetical protein